MPFSCSRQAALLKELLAYAPSDRQETKHRDAMVTLLEAGADPFCRDQFFPGHFTASAFVLNPERNALVLILHRKLKRWLQPGGHIEPGDTSPLAAAARETREETGLQTIACSASQLFDLDVHAIPGRLESPEHKHYDLRFLLCAQMESELLPNDEVTDAKWVPLADVSTWESDASVMRAVRKIQTSLPAVGDQDGPI